MKVIVCFDETRITVPCGNGDILVKDLVNEAISRYKRATGKGTKVKIRVHTVKSVNDGGILDFNDQIASVVDDREQIMALFEEDSDELDMHLASDGMSAGSSSTDTWRPDSENSEKNSHLASDPGGAKPTSLITRDQHWLFERSGLMAEEQNGIEIKEDDDVQMPAGLSLSVRRGSESALENARDLEEEADVTPQPQLKRWSTAAVVYGAVDNSTRQKIIISLPTQTNNLPKRQGSLSDLSPSNSEALPPYLSHKSSSTQPIIVTPLQEAGEEETNVVIVPRSGEPVGLHLIPERETKGMRIQAIDGNSVAELSGLLHLNDRIVDVNGLRVDDLDFGRAQEILRSAVAQGGAVKIRVCSAVAVAQSASSAAPSSSASSPEELLPPRQLNNKRTPPPLPPKPKLPHDLETMLQRANYEASLDYTPDDNDYNSEGLYTYGSLRRPGRKLTIDLLKGPEGLGFTITTRDNPAGTVCPIYVKSILSKGAAYKDGRLKTGDRLMEVNGIDLTGKSQDEVVNLLRGLAYNTEVVLVVGRPETTSPVLPRVLEVSTEPLQSENKAEALEKNKEILTFDIALNATGSAGLGVRVKGKATRLEDVNREDGIFVMNVIQGGAASKDGRLQPMDQLLSVNGISLLNQSNQDAMENLRRAMQAHGTSSPVMSITIARELSASQKSNGVPENSAIGIPIPQAEHTALNHIIRVPSSPNIYSVSPHSEIIPPKPPRLYQALPAMTSVTIAGGRADPILIEGDDSIAEVLQTTPTNSSASQMTQKRLDELRDPYDADCSMDYDPFSRDGFARQSMSEKRHAHLDPRYLETYRKSKQALAARSTAAKSHTPSPSNPSELDDQNLRRANSLESVMKGPTVSATGGGSGPRRSKAAANRNRGCNESFRVAVDRSYEAERDEEQDDKNESRSFDHGNHSKDENIEVIETVNSHDGIKKQRKSSGFLRGLLRRSGNKKNSEGGAAVETTTTSKPSKPEEQAAKAKQAALDEQQRINVHYQKFKADMQQQQQHSYQQHSSIDVRSPPKKLNGVEQRATIVHVQPNSNPGKPIVLQNGLPYVTSDPYGHYMNYDEIQRALRRKSNTAPAERQRPVSNFFEYGAPPPPTNGHLRGNSTANVRLGNGIYGHITKPLGDIREVPPEKLAANRGVENIYGVSGRRGASKAIIIPSAAALKGSQV